jgi:hypothetical protein
MRRFASQVRLVASERALGAHDWPALELELDRVEAAGIERDYATTLIVGLRACEREKDDPARQEAVKDAQSFVNFKKARAGKEGPRQHLRALSMRPIERAQTLLAYGFSLDREKSWISKSDFYVLAPAILFVMHINPANPGQSEHDQVYQIFRQRLRRLMKREAEHAVIVAEARQLFRTVYAELFL